MLSSLIKSNVTMLGSKEPLSLNTEMPVQTNVNNGKSMRFCLPNETIGCIHLWSNINIQQIHM